MHFILVGIEMHALSLYFISATCFSIFIVYPTNTGNSHFSHTCLCTFSSNAIV